MSGAQRCATESQEASIGRERRQYFSSPAFAELVSPIGTVMTATTHGYAIADFALLPLVGAMMTSLSPVSADGGHVLLPLVGAMMTGPAVSNRRTLTALLPLVGAMMTVRPCSSRAGPRGCCPS